MKNNQKKIGVAFLGEYSILPVVEQLQIHMESRLRARHGVPERRMLYLDKSYKPSNINLVRGIVELALVGIKIDRPRDAYNIFYYDEAKMFPEEFANKKSTDDYIKDVKSGLSTAKKVFKVVKKLLGMCRE